MRAKSQKPKPHPKPQKQEKRAINTTQKLPASIFQLNKGVKPAPKRHVGRPFQRKKAGFRSDGDIERLARDIVEKASLQNQLFRAQEHQEVLSQGVTNAKLSLEIPLESPHGAIPESDESVDNPVSEFEQSLSVNEESIKDGYPASSAYDTYSQDGKPHTQTPLVNTGMHLDPSAQNSLRQNKTESASSTMHTLPAVAEIERWYEEQLQQL